MRVERFSAILNCKKILYFAQAEFLVATGKPCFSEAIEAWDWGPVVSKVYYRYKGFGAAAIPWMKEQKRTFPFGEEERARLDGIIMECGRYSAAELTEFTQKQTPWRECYQEHRRVEIPNESIGRFFGD